MSEANQRGHWSKGAKRAKEQRSVARMKVYGAGAVRLRGWTALAVTLTRLAPRRLDSDNLQRALKAVRDGVADALGVDDGDPRIEWRYGQRKAMSIDGIEMRSLRYGVEIRIEAKEGS